MRLADSCRLFTSPGDPTSQAWYFPHPLDARLPRIDNKENSKKDHFNPEITRKPTPPLPDATSSAALEWTVGRTVPATKEESTGWWRGDLWASWLGAGENAATPPHEAPPFVQLKDFSHSESYIGIGIDPESGAQDKERFYSAHYLRLREEWSLGLLARMSEKTDDPGQRLDLLPSLFPGDQSTILVGGQQRQCTVRRRALPPTARLPLPLGCSQGFATAAVNGATAHLVKWTLLTPAVFPALPAGPETPAGHPGGWLPCWVDPATREVRLPQPTEPRQPRESRESYRARVRALPPIPARLLAALTGRPLPVTGWGLGAPDRPEAGARPILWAVPAGAVYYFACPSAEAATNLAAALNWHGTSPGTEIQRRRSTLFGEKGFGLGVCSSWSPLNLPLQSSTPS